MVSNETATVPSETATDADADTLVSRLERDGFAVVHGLVPLDVIDRVAQELELFFSKTPNGEADFFGHKTKRMGAIVRKSPTCHGLIMHPVVLDVMEAVLGPNCDRIQLNLTQAIRIEPGERQQIYHNDDELFPTEKHGKQFMVNVMWALDDFTEENGATHVVVGSHRKEITREPAKADIIQARMKRGGALIWLGSTLHCGGANRSKVSRTGLTISYALGWLRQAENQYLAVPPEFARTLAPRLQELLGYRIHRPNLGWYEGQDPSVVLDGNPPDVLAARDFFAPEITDAIKEYYQQLEL